MKNQLMQLLIEAEELLRHCGWPEQATWFREIRREVDAAEIGSVELKKCLSDLGNAIAGMGSFSDLPLESPSGGESARELRSRQWGLTAAIGDAVSILLQRSRACGDQEPHPG